MGFLPTAQSFIPEARWRHKLAADHSDVTWQSLVVGLNRSLAAFPSSQRRSLPPSASSARRSVLSNGPTDRTSPSGDLRPPARVRGHGEGPIVCRAARIACSLWQRRGRRTKSTSPTGPTAGGGSEHTTEQKQNCLLSSFVFSTQPPSHALP